MTGAHQMRTIMARVTQFFRTSFRAVTAALFIGLVTQTFASAHSGEPVKLVKLEPEVAYTFNYDGAVYEVYNTHLINFAGLERIEIRTLAGQVAKTWWSRRGWCFTQEAYAGATCMSQDRYQNYFAQKLSADALSFRVTAASGVGWAGRRSSVLDDYPCLNKRLSSNQAASVELTAPDC